MAVKKERRSTPRKAAAGAEAPLSDTPVTKSTTPQREVPEPAADEEPPAEQPSPEDIRRRIEMQAYFKAKARGFAPGYELQDWLEAEREVKQRAANRH
jgi:hypothetical protein